MKLFSSKKRVAVLVAGIVLALFWWRPGASRLKSRLVASMSAGIGRPVEVGAVNFRLLPRPGFDLEGLVVYDDPAFGAEPILRASEVTAAVRLTSLVRGKLEIARLDLTEPSLNLVHTPGGRWNIEALLERSSHIPLAPTAKAKTEPRPGFPYIQATSGRINFKSNEEKKPYALTNADFSFWQESENTWGVRLRAQPFRTDSNLNDIGLLEMSGTWQRAETLRDTPVQLQWEWRRAQLGQFTKFFTGIDQGWRGEMLVDAAVTGTPAKLHFLSRATVDDFRRYDITSGQALHLSAQCEGEYSSTSHDFHGVHCGAPVSGGVITLDGDAGLPGTGRYDLELEAKEIPAASALVLAERLKKNLPQDLTAEGTMQGKLSMRSGEAQGSPAKTTAALGSRFEGRGEITGLVLRSVMNKAEIGPQTVSFAMSDGSGNAGKADHGRTDRGPHAGIRAMSQQPQEAHIEIGPVELGAKTGTLTARGWLTRSKYEMDIAGDSDLPRVLRLARLAGVPTIRTTPEGGVQLDVSMAGYWRPSSSGKSVGFGGPLVTGTAKLRNVHVALIGTGGPIEIAGADVQLLAEKVSVTKLSAKAVGASWSGSIEMPRGCVGSGTCPARFQLNASEIDLHGWNEWASPSPKARPWYRMLEADAPSATALLGELQASGRLTADRLQVQKATATHVSADITLDSGKLTVANINAALLGGAYRGDFQADFNVKPTACGGSGTLSKISLTGLADLMKDQWIRGTADASYEVKGICQTGFWETAEGSLRLNATDGALPHITVSDGGGPLAFSRMSAQVGLKAAVFDVKNATFETPGGKYALTGTASLKRQVEMKLAQVPTGGSYAISGDLADPQIHAVSGTEQAKLKR